MPQRRDVKTPEKIDINMTPMIDVVFQLLAFFLMTFKVASVEGDFNLKLPKSERSAGAANTQTEMINVAMRALPNGVLGVVQIDNNPPQRAGMSTFSDLQKFVTVKVSAAQAAGQEEPEIQIDADDTLRYEYVIKAIEAVSATTDAEGKYKPLAKKVKFAPKAEAAP